MTETRSGKREAGGPRRAARAGGLAGFVLAAVALAVALAATEPATTARGAALAAAALGALLVLAYLVLNGPEVADFLRSRQFLYGGNLVLAVAVAGAIVVFLNLIGAKYYATADWTRTANFTLSSTTRNLLRSLTDEVRVMTFFPEGPDLDRLRDLLERYKRLSGNLVVRYVNINDATEVRPLVAKYDLKEANVVVVDYRGNKKVLERYEMFTSSAPGPPYGRERPREIFKGEDAITSAIRTLVEEKPPVVMFTTGFGEPSIDSYSDARAFAAAAEALRRNNMKCESLNIFGLKEIPDTCDLLVVAAPEKPYGPTEVRAIRRFLEERDGKALFLLEPYLTAAGGRLRMEPTGLEGLLEDLGLEVQASLVVEGVGYRLMDPMTFMAGGSSYLSHPIVDALEGATTVWSSVRSLKETDRHEGYQVSPLIQTSPRSWAETDLTDLEDGRIQFDEGVDLKGPLTIAAAITRSQPAPPPGSPPEEPEGMRVVVFGDGNFAGNGMIGTGDVNRSGHVNRDLFLNAVRWLTRRTASMGIEPKVVDEVFFSLRRQQTRLVWLITMGMAVLAVAVGAVVWIVRR